MGAKKSKMQVKLVNNYKFYLYLPITKLFIHISFHFSLLLFIY